MPANRFITDSIVEHSVNLLRFAAGAKARVRELMTAMEIAIATALIAEGVSEMNADSVLQSISDSIAEHYMQVAALVSLKLAGVAVAESMMIDAMFSKLSEGALRLVLLQAPQLNHLAATALIQGANSAAWWEQQAAATDFAVRSAVRQGLRNGDTTAQIIARVRGDRQAAGVLDTSANSAARIVQTAVATVANEARLETFKANTDVINGIEQVSTLDGHTSDICIAYSGAQWDMDYEPIAPTTLPYNGGVPRHWNCRSVMVPIVKTFAELGINLPDFPMSTRASDEGQLRANITFKEFLDGKSDAYQDELLGPGRAQLYRDGTITLQQLLDVSGNPLTLAQLKARYVH